MPCGWKNCRAKCTKIRCGRCKKKKYCSNECLRSDWHCGHARECTPGIISHPISNEDIGVPMSEKAYVPKSGTSFGEIKRDPGWWKNLPEDASDELLEEAFEAMQAEKTSVLAYKGTECTPFLGIKTTLDGVEFLRNDTKYGSKAKLTVVTVARIKKVNLPKIKNDTCDFDPAQVLYCGCFFEEPTNQNVFNFTNEDLETVARWSLLGIPFEDDTFEGKIKIQSPSLMSLGNFTTNVDSGVGQLFSQALGDGIKLDGQEKISGEFSKLIIPDSQSDMALIDDDFVPSSNTDWQLLIAVGNHFYRNEGNEIGGGVLRLRYSSVESGTIVFVGDNIIANSGASLKGSIPFVSLRYDKEEKKLFLKQAGVLWANTQSL